MRIKLHAIAAIAAIGIGGYVGFPKVDNTSQAVLDNLEALSSDVEPGGGTQDVKGDNSDYPICSGGFRDMASVCVDSGFFTTQCTISGEISLFGITLKGSYTRGTQYCIPWARYSCQESKGNCCKKQGLFSGEMQQA